MISFETVKSTEICKTLFAKHPDIAEFLSDLLENVGEGSVALCKTLGATVVRCFDGEEYFFLSPFDGFSEEVIEAVREYAVKEEIGLLLRGVCKKDLGRITGAFYYCDVRIEDPLSALYSVRVKSECDLTKKAPAVRGVVTLSALTGKDIQSYALVCREESGNEFWGYDYREDEQEASDEYFYNVQRSEFMRGVSLTLGVRYKGRLIGEAALYAFDFKGGAEISFRILPEYRGRGLGRATLEGLLSVAEEIGLTAVYATVDKRNESSLRLIGGYMDEYSETKDRKRFILRGEEA